jgi:hypothetical protein
VCWLTESWPPCSMASPLTDASNPLDQSRGIEAAARHFKVPQLSLKCPYDLVYGHFWHDG